MGCVENKIENIEGSVMANKHLGVYLLGGGASATEDCDHCVKWRCCTARFKRAKRKGVRVNKKLQGNRLQVEQEWVLFGQKTQQADVWKCLLFCFTKPWGGCYCGFSSLSFSLFLKFQLMKTPVLPLGGKLFCTLINPTICLFLH